MPNTLTTSIATIGAVASALLLSACAVDTGRTVAADALTADQLVVLENNLGGRTAGPPVNCISSTLASNTIRVSDSILLYRVSGRLTYRNDLRSSCPGLARDDDVIVTHVSGNGPCRGDIIRLVDRTSGIGGGSCTLGSFTPYRRTAAN